MSHPGFVHESLDVKVVILYNMARVTAPVDFDTLTDLALCDPGIDFFLYAQAVEQLVDSGHLTRGDDGLYTITDKGRANGGILEGDLSPVVRDRCDKALARVNAALRRSAQVTAQVLEDAPGRCHVELGLSDNAGPLLELRLTVPDPRRGQEMARRFQKHPEDVLNAILACLAREPRKEK